MKLNKVDWEKEMTQDDFLDLLRELQHKQSSPRQLTELRGKGWLPELQRRSRPGSNKPVNVWDESAVEQALFLFELLEVSHADHWVRQALWFRGHQVDFAPIRQRWLDSIDAYLQAFTQGEGHDPRDNLNDAVSELKRKWGHTPTQYRPEPIRRLGLEGYAQWTEDLWDVLLIPDPDEATLAEILALVPLLDAAGENTQVREQVAEDSLPWLQTLQKVLAIPQVRQVIEQATPEEWERARLDYMTLCQFCQTLFAPATQAQPKEFTLLLFVGAGSHLVPMALAIRYAGYDHWIDDAFAWVSDLLDDPDTIARLAEQLARRGTESPG